MSHLREELQAQTDLELYSELTEAQLRVKELSGIDTLGVEQQDQYESSCERIELIHEIIEGRCDFYGAGQSWEDRHKPLSYVHPTVAHYLTHSKLHKEER